MVEEFKLRVVYIPANPPSPVPEEEEDEIDSLDSDVDHEVQMPSTFDAVSTDIVVYIKIKMMICLFLMIIYLCSGIKEGIYIWIASFT